MKKIFSLFSKAYFKALNSTQITDAASSSGSLILLHQLEDKLKAHEYFVTFLKEIDIWDRVSVTTGLLVKHCLSSLHSADRFHMKTILLFQLSSVKRKDEKFSSHMLLCEHAEKLTAAMALRNLHMQYVFQKCN